MEKGLNHGSRKREGDGVNLQQNMSYQFEFQSQIYEFTQKNQQLGIE